MSGIVMWWQELATAERWAIGVLVSFVLAGIVGPIVGTVLGRRSNDYPAPPTSRVAESAALPAVPPREGMTAIDRQTGTQRRAVGGQWQ